jgi:hypothetical protein
VRVCVCVCVCVGKIRLESLERGLYLCKRQVFPRAGGKVNEGGRVRFVWSQNGAHAAALARVVGGSGH